MIKKNKIVVYHQLLQMQLKNDLSTIITNITLSFESSFSRYKG